MWRALGKEHVRTGKRARKRNKTQKRRPAHPADVAGRVAVAALPEQADKNTQLIMQDSRSRRSRASRPPRRSKPFFLAFRADGRGCRDEPHWIQPIA